MQGRACDAQSICRMTPATVIGGKRMAKANKGSTMSRLHSASRLSRTALASRLLAHGFYAGQDQIMIALSQEDGQTPGQLAIRLGVRPPTITKTINRLQAQGFLDKKASDHDARQAHIFLTDPGRDTIRAIEKSLRKTEKQALKGLDKKDQKTLAKLLARIEANLSDSALAEVDDEIDADD
jgi:DNA-binding MarR family transcriptional regulator